MNKSVPGQGSDEGRVGWREGTTIDLYSQSGPHESLQVQVRNPGQFSKMIYGESLHTCMSDNYYIEHLLLLVIYCGPNKKPVRFMAK